MYIKKHDIMGDKDMLMVEIAFDDWGKIKIG